MDWALAKQIGAPLAVSAILGLCWFAYNHPNSYRRVSFVALLLLAMVYLAAFGWIVGYQMGAEAALSFAKSDGSGFDKTPIGYSLIFYVVPIYLVLQGLLYVHLLKDK